MAIAPAEIRIARRESGVFNVLCWIKNEGIFYGLFLVISLVVTYSFSKRDKILVLFGSIIILSLRLFLFNYYNTELNPGYFEMEKTLKFDFSYESSFKKFIN